MGSLLSILLFAAFFYLMMKYGCGAHVHGGGCGHKGHERHNTNGETKSRDGEALKTTGRDPVCGKDIEIAQAVRSIRYGRSTYYFCSKDCIRKFRERPEYFAEIERMERRYIA